MSIKEEQLQRPERRILLSGSTGLIGCRVLANRRAIGDWVVPLIREKTSSMNSECVRWDPMRGSLDPADVSGFDVAIHLAGEPVADARWTSEKKTRIRDSRVRGTATLATALAACARPPSAFICASGINFYGEQGDVIVDESTPRGAGFLAETCEAWEAAASPLENVCRVAHLRIGVVLAKDGGPLTSMLPAFRWCLGGPIAGGNQFISWVTIGDVIRAIDHVIAFDQLSGPLNVVSPEPVTNLQFTKALAAALHRRAIVPVPRWLVRLAFGELANETVLTSIRAIPRRLQADGLFFGDPEIQNALNRMLARVTPTPGNVGETESGN